jgi:protein-S-isoprenylcysteine O-methyltransferase Ste14
MNRLAALVMKQLAGTVFILLMFAAAGTFYWPRFWFILGFYVPATSGLMLWLRLHDPGLFKERMSVRKDVKAWDKVIIRIYAALLMVVYIVVPLDAVRFRLSHVPAIFSWLAFTIVFLAWILAFWTFRENAFLSTLVRIQTDRGHTVCTTGPYRFVRHPLYVAIILFNSGVPIFLGSLYALIPAGLIAGLFILRTSLEDRTLQRELPGYAEYASKTRWKLIPKLW